MQKNTSISDFSPFFGVWNYPFGMLMPERSSNSDSYRYAYNGMETDNEAKGNGNSYTTEFRQYDPRLGRWLSLDPLMHMFPSMSPYCAFDNNPIYFTDPYGLSAGGPPENDGTTIGETQMSEGSEWIWTQNENSDSPFWAKMSIMGELTVVGDKQQQQQVKPLEQQNLKDIDLVLIKAKQFSDANVTGMTYQSPSTTSSIEEIKLGSKGIDCSQFINQIFLQAGFLDPGSEKGSPTEGVPVGNKGSATNGVALIIDDLPIIDQNSLKRGDLVTFRTSRTNHQGPDGAFDHIGIVRKVTRINGVVMNIEYYDSGGSNSTALKKRTANPNSKYKAGPRLQSYDFTEPPCEDCNKYTGSYRPNYKKTATKKI